MIIQLLSDLHLEAHPNWQPTYAKGADLLVLAGDIGSYQEGSLLATPDFGLSRFSPLYGWPTPVLFVPGNHEYDARPFNETHEQLQHLCRSLGILWLESTTLTWAEIQRHQEMIGLHNRRGDFNIRFIGTTLWTDFDAFASQETSSTREHQAREKAFRAANFYLKKAKTTLNSEPMLATAIRQKAFACQEWLSTELAAPFQGETVVITHFAPTLLSADPRYGLTPGTAGFCNALDPLLKHANLWLHGHVHTKVDYVHNGCRVVANPLGYLRKDEQKNFLPASTITLAPQKYYSPNNKLEAG